MMYSGIFEKMGTKEDYCIVVPARSGSTRVRDKNIRDLSGKPLFEYTLDVIEEIDAKMNTVISTNCDTVREISLRRGYRVRIRPDEICTSSASTESTLLDAVKHFCINAEWIVTLQPTSPFRSGRSLKGLIERLNKLDDNVECLLTVTKTYGDFWLASAGKVERLFKKAPRRQQDRKPLYEENSMFYATRLTTLERTKSVLGCGDRVCISETSEIEGFDINTEADLELARFISEGQRKSK